MGQNYISNDVFEQDEELKQRYIRHGLCKGCKQPNTYLSYYAWCQSCNSKRFQQNFQNWTSGNSDIDKLIQESQLNAKNYFEGLNGLNMIDLKILSISQKEVLGKYIKHFGEMDT